MGFAHGICVAVSNGVRPPDGGRHMWSVWVTNWQATRPTTDQARAWARVRANLRESAGARLFDQWLKPMELIEGDEPDTVRLSLPSAFATNWVRSHYADRLHLEFKAVLPEVRAVFIENITNHRLLDQIARETGAKIGGTLYSDALSPPGGPAPTYLDMFRHNIGALTAALSSELRSSIEDNSK